MSTLTSLDEALDRLRDVTARAVGPRRVPVARAVGHVLAEPLSPAADLPPHAIAAGDGIAIAAAITDGAGPYAPVLVAGPARVGVGDAMPAGTDAVVAAGEFAWRGGSAALSQPVAPGEGVREAGRDARAGAGWRRAGDRLRAGDLPLLDALGIAAVSVVVPRVVLLPTGDRFAPPAPAADLAGPALAALLARDGAACVQRPAVLGDRAAIAAALAGAASQGDLVLMTGGTGAGPGDHAADALAEAGDCLVHGIGLRPGGSAGIGRVGGTPVLLLPGQPAAALGAWLALGRVAVRRLAGGTVPRGCTVRLARKLVSAPGVAELALLRRAEDGDAMLPSAAGDLTLSGFAMAAAYVIVAAGSEGYEVGAAIDCLAI